MGRTEAGTSAGGGSVPTVRRTGGAAVSAVASDAAERGPTLSPPHDPSISQHITAVTGFLSLKR